MQIARGAWRLVVVPIGLAIPGMLVSPIVGAALAVLAGFVLYFHRDPDRTPPPAGILAPADGRITVLREESNEGETRVRVGVFMGLTDVHVNRAPLGGGVKRVAHHPGGHWPAFSKASDRNERVEIECGDHSVRLIAGAFARRIRPYVSPGDQLTRGQRIAHVSFGSRADVLMPASVSLDGVLVSTGDRVRAGETVLARR